MLAASFILLASTVGCAGNGPSLSSYPNSQCLNINNQDVVRDQASGKIAHSSSGACVRTKWIVDHNPCNDDVVEPKDNFAVYFGSNQTSLTPQAIAELDAFVSTLKGNPHVLDIRIVGYADRIGKAAHNEALSKARAENVRQYIVAKGLIKAKLAKTNWVGDKKTTANCANTLKRDELNKCLKKDRRVEIEVDFVSDVHTGK